MITESGNFKFEKGTLDNITGEKVFNDYLELINAMVGGDAGIYQGTVDAMTYYAYDEMREWDWKQSSIFDGILSDMWTEAEWFQTQANHLFGVDDWRDIDDWKTYSSHVDFEPNYENFGEI